MSTPKVSLINNIGNPPNSPSKQTRAISDSGADIHLSKQSTTTMSPFIMSNYMVENLPDGSTMEFSHTETLQLPVLRKQARQIHISPKMRTEPLILLVFLCDDGCNITLDKQKLPVKKWATNNKSHHKQANRNMRSPPGDTKIRNCGK